MPPINNHINTQQIKHQQISNNSQQIPSINKSQNSLFANIDIKGDNKSNLNIDGNNYANMFNYNQ